MKKQINNSVFQELINSIQFCVDSQKGKYSLETYLQIVGTYSDRLIMESEKEGITYIGGSCKVKKNNGQCEFLDFYVEMFFQDSNGNSIKKEAHRKLSTTKFTREAISSIGNEEIEFNIDKPEGRS